MKYIILFITLFVAYFTTSAMEDIDKIHSNEKYNRTPHLWSFKTRKEFALQSFDDFLHKDWQILSLQEKDNVLKEFYQESIWAIRCLKNFYSDNEIIVYLNSNNFTEALKRDPVEGYLRYRLIKIKHMSILEKYLSKTHELKATPSCIKDRERADRLWDIDPKTWKISSKL